MSRFSKRAPSARSVVKNLAGGSGYRESAELELASLVLTSFATDQHYRTANAAYTQLGSLIDALPDKTFAARAGIFARNEYGMRSITHVLAAELGARIKGQSWTRSFFDKIVRRPDDMLEIAAYYLDHFGKPLPNAMKKGFASAFARFDAYALAKYRGEGKTVKMVDLVNLVHPKPTIKNRKALKQLMAGELASSETWEAKLTKAGQEAEDSEDLAERKASAWHELLAEEKLGYFALLRNLRNIADQAPECMPLALHQLQDVKRIKGSLVMPFRFLTAYDELANPTIKRAISEAAEISLGNIPLLPGRTVVMLDASGSMWDGTQKEPARIGALFATALVRAWGADLLVFDTRAAMLQRTEAGTGLLEDASQLSALVKQNFNGGTSVSTAFQCLPKAYDRIILLSDMQTWTDYGISCKRTLELYRQRTGADPWLYSFDLAGYGQLAFPQSKVAAIAGFSDKTFDLFGMLEMDRGALVKKIKAVRLDS